MMGYLGDLFVYCSGIDEMVVVVTRLLLVVGQAQRWMDGGAGRCRCGQATQASSSLAHQASCLAWLVDAVDTPPHRLPF